LDRELQATAVRQLSGRAGAIVVLDPRTGAVKVLAASGGTSPGTLWAPEATFDVVTAAAALDSGRYDSSSRISGASPAPLSGTTVRNSQGQTTLGQALAFSVNTDFARIGERLGRGTITTYMRRFGFYSSPGIDGIPASGLRVGGALVLPSAARVPVGALASGHSDLRATALQMGMVAATVANGGVLAWPHLHAAPAQAGDRLVMSARTARLLTQMLRSAVSQGTAS